MSVIFITGATGLVGERVVRRLLADGRVDRIVALVRPGSAAAMPRDVRSRVSLVHGDLTQADVGLAAEDRARLARTVTDVIHCGADTTFSRPLHRARAVNTLGTARLLTLASHWGIRRFVHVSTAYVAGTCTGRVLEGPCAPAGFVNAYEQSKHEAEALVRAAAVETVILRPSTIVCDDVTGVISQHNAVHRALRVMHAGLAPMMPGEPDTPVDFVTAEYVARAIVHIGLAQEATGTYHLCAGEGALPLAELLDRAFAYWRRDAAWCRRGTLPPVLTGLDTYRAFESAVAETGDARLAAVARSLSHFAPQMALPKFFDTTRADAIAGGAIPVGDYWERVLGLLGRERVRVAA